MRKLLLAAALTVGLSGCNFWYNEVPSPDDLMHNIPWFDHMILSQAVHPYQRDDIPRNTPAGVVPVGGGEADWQRGDPGNPSFPQYGFDTTYAKALTRPTTPPAPAARSGEQLYQIYCSVCHGDRGAADGTVTKYLAAPSLLTAQARGLADGTIYSFIRYGNANMPRYGDKITRIDERWLVVDYVRELQSAAPISGAGGN